MQIETLVFLKYGLSPAYTILSLLPKELHMKRSSISVFGIAMLILTILLSNQPTAVHAAAQLYFTNFDTGYSDWTATSATGGISLATSPVITGSSVHIINTGNITRTVSTVGYSGISVTSNLAASLLETGDW